MWSLSCLILLSLIFFFFLRLLSFKFCYIHFNILLFIYLTHSFKTRTGPAGRPETRPTQAWNRSGWRPKPGWELTRPDPGDPVGWPGTRLTRQDPTSNPLTFIFFLFFFLLKRRCFDFFKKKNLTRPTRSKPGTRALDRADHRAGS